ncbi:MAG TPA: methyltransferase domain-containing protein [Puia sp.]|nr:methyltransferase domain-containing protein [Puia sp.]
MELQEAISLIHTDELIQDTQKTWADLGCGSGLFTRALADQLYAGSTVYAIDKNLSSFNTKTFPNHVILKAIESDFVKDELNLENLDGILMANAFHFVRDKKSFIKKIIPYFRNTPLFLFVEYDTNLPNPWVPYPKSFDSLKKLFNELGFSFVKMINEKKSLYRSGKLYSVLITR